MPIEDRTSNQTRDRTSDRTRDRTSDRTRDRTSDRTSDRIRSPHVPISREVLAQLDTDVTIFDKTAFISQVLENCSWKQLEDIDATITDDIVRLRTAKKTLMSENYAKFITLKENLTAAVATMEQMQEIVEGELQESHDAID